MIGLLLLLPVIGSLIILPIQNTNYKNITFMKNIALIVSIINFLVSIVLWLKFDSSTTEYQFVYEFNELSFCHLNVGVDSISLFFVLITTFITPIALLSNYSNITPQYNIKFLLVSLLLLETLQIALFVVLDLMLFYIFFESVLPILFILIILYGSGHSRFRSANLLFLYTLAGSLPMLLSILVIYSHVGSTDFTIISLNEISLESQKLLWLGFFIAFAVKTPIWPLHTWLAWAHSNSPLAGSILLAATVLKFATYGILRVLINILPDATHYFSPLVQTLAIISLLYASLTTIIQHDTKTLVAYSSVAHMAVVTLGLFSNTIQGIEGAILFGIAHAFVSPALFICVGGVLYDRYHVRTIPYLRGLVQTMPIFTILFFIFTLGNTGIPLTLNFIAEQLCLIGIWQINPVTAILGATGIVFSAVYSIYFYNRISYGVPNPDVKVAKDINRREFTILVTLLIPTILLGILPNVILKSLHLSVTTLLYVV
jgi:NADH-ubiquinone oxidoreductase chain 4